MNDEQAKALGMLAKTLPGFSWQPRMMNGRLELCALAVLEEGDRTLVLWEPDGSWYDFKDDWHVLDPEDWPDFRDPPTMGWLLHQVREAWGDQGAAAIHYSRSGGWQPNVGDMRESWSIAWYKSEAEALLAMLEHAPRQNAATPRKPHTSEEGARCPQ